MAKYIRKLTDNYCVLDTETTGLSAYFDDVIEIGILRVRDNTIVDKYEQLINPGYEIDPYITALTGITNQMLQDQPSLSQCKDKVIDFIGDDILVGHNTSFDIKFLEMGFDIALNNEYVDTLQFARKLYPQLEHHRLTDLSEYLHLTVNKHRSLADCETTKELYDSIKKKMNTEGLLIQNLWSEKKRRGGHQIDISKIIATIEIDSDSFFYGKHVVFTGKLEKMIRKDAMQIVVNLGGF